MKEKNRKTDATHSCPCCSGKEFQYCCAPILADHSLAATPEMLMRSRYTAFVLQDAAHLLNSWDYPFRPDTLPLEENVRWLSLTIDKAPLPSEEAQEGLVSYTATFIQNSMLIEMRENSVFVRRKDTWYYQEGDCTTSKKALSQNSPCPCSSAKKFKRCCFR